MAIEIKPRGENPPKLVFLKNGAVLIGTVTESGEKMLVRDPVGVEIGPNRLGMFPFPFGLELLGKSVSDVEVDVTGNVMLVTDLADQFVEKYREIRMKISAAASGIALAGPGTELPANVTNIRG